MSTMPPMPANREDFADALRQRDALLAHRDAARQGQEEAALAERRAAWPEERARLTAARVKARRAAEEAGQPVVFWNAVDDLPMEAPSWWLDAARVAPEAVQAANPVDLARAYGTTGRNLLGQSTAPREPTPEEAFAAADRKTLAQRMWPK